MQLEKGSVLFLYTDGVAEASNAENELFGTDRLLEALNVCDAATPKEVLDGVIDDAYLIGMIIGFFASILWGFVISRISEKNFGMVNGDVLGATNETSRTVVLFCMIATFMIMARL